MKHALKLISALSILTAISTPAIAADGATHVTTTPTAIEYTPKTAISSAVIRVDYDVPEMIVPLNVDFKTDVAATVSEDEYVQQSNYDFIESDGSVDLLDDSDAFIGVPPSSRFDTDRAQMRRGAMPKGTFVDPMVPLASAGIRTKF